MKHNSCEQCNAEDILPITTYKRTWAICKKCGTATSIQRENYPLQFMPIRDLKRSSELSEEKMYDYFIEDIHINWSKAEGERFVGEFIKPFGIDVVGKNLLDISGGNGHFIKEIEKLGCKVTLTEINKKTIEYARKIHGFDVLEYNINSDRLFEKTGRKFDLIFARACLMFAKDLNSFAKQLKDSINANGMLVIHRSVVPTLGVMLRTQLDEFSYLVLRESATVIKTFEMNGFKLLEHKLEIDPSLYINDHDLRWHWSYLHNHYESKAIKQIASDRKYAWVARDRRFDHFVFERID